MAKIYRASTKSINNNTYTVELWQGTDTSGAFIDLQIENINIEWQGENGRYHENAIIPSRAKVTFTAYETDGDLNASVYANLELIGLDEEAKWSMVIYKGTDLHWVGRVLADQMRFKRAANQSFNCEVVAVDALALIDGFNVDETFFAGGEISFIDMLIKCLNKANLKDNWTNAGLSNNYIHDGLEHRNASQDSSLGIAYWKFNQYAFVKDLDETTGVLNWVSCKEAIEMMLTAFGGRMFLSNGVYWLLQANSYDTTTIDFDIYKTTGAWHATGAGLAHALTVNASSRPAWEAKPVISFQAPCREIEVDYTKKNVLSAVRTSSSSSLLTLTGNIPVKALRVRFVFNNKSTITGWYRLVYRLRFLAKNTGTGVYYAWDAAARTWTNIGTSLPTGGTWANTLYSDYVINTQELTSYSFDFTAPPPPVGVDAVYADMEMFQQSAIYTIAPGATSGTWSVSSPTNVNFTGGVFIEYAYNASEPYQFDYKGKATSGLSSPRTTNSNLIKVQSGFYNGSYNDAGNVKVWSGSAWINPGNWSVGWTANTGDLPQVLARQLAALYRDFVKTIRGTIHDGGNYYAARSLSFDSGVWIFNGVTFDAQSETWEGEWIEVNQTFTGVNDNGEGERVSTDTEKIYDRLQDIDLKITRHDMAFSDLGQNVIGQIVNDAAIDEPADNDELFVKIVYDSTDKVFTYKLDTNRITEVSSTPFTATLDHDVLVVTNANNTTINLPTAASSNLKKYTIKKMSTGSYSVTIEPNGSEEIDETANYVFSTQYDAITIISNGTEWFII